MALYPNFGLPISMLLLLRRQIATLVRAYSWHVIDLTGIDTDASTVTEVINEGLPRAAYLIVCI